MTSIWIPEAILKNISSDKDDLIRIISRVVILVPPSLNGESSANCVDHDLAQFYSMIKYIAKIYQYLSEVFILEEFVNGKIEISRESILNLIKSAGCLPLYNVSIGIIVKKLLQGKNINDLKKEMLHIIDIQGDLIKAWVFWKDFQNIVKILASPNDSIRNILNDASKLFKTALISEGIHVI